jgi:hypothetical protein
MDSISPDGCCRLDFRIGGKEAKITSSSSSLSQHVPKETEGVSLNGTQRHLGISEEEEEEVIMVACFGNDV